MNKYLLIENNETSGERRELATIHADSLNQAALYLAYYFPESYYSANIVRVVESENDSKDFMCIGCSEYYASENNGVVPNPVEIALKHMMIDMKYENESRTKY